MPKRLQPAWNLFKDVSRHVASQRLEPAQGKNAASPLEFQGKTVSTEELSADLQLLPLLWINRSSAGLATLTPRDGSPLSVNRKITRTPFATLTSAFSGTNAVILEIPTALPAPLASRRAPRRLIHPPIFNDLSGIRFPDWERIAGGRVSLERSEQWECIMNGIIYLVGLVVVVLAVLSMLGLR